MRQAQRKMFLDFASLWDVNPYRGSVLTERKSVARDLQKEFGTDFSQAIAEYLNYVHIQAKKQPLDEGSQNLYLFVAVQTYVAYGHYRATEDAPDVKVGEAVEGWLNSSGWNLKGVIAAAARCDRNLNPTSKKRLVFGNSDQIKKLKESIWSACFGSSLTDAVRYHELLRRENVLIFGETGTGKENIARIISESAFNNSDSAMKEFRVVNAAAIPETLLESELFGHKKNAFTGATRDKEGMIEEANDGTFFFDEIGDLPIQLQHKILRVLEKGQIRRVGETVETTVDVKFIGATLKNLDDMVNVETFRKDLYQRFKGHVINTVPLRKLTNDDILDIGESFVSPKDSAIYRIIFRAHLENEYRDYCWPGNMRELRNVIGSIMLRGYVSELDGKYRPQNGQSIDSMPDNLINFTWKLEELDKWYVKMVLEKNGNKKVDAAKILGISYNQFYRKYRN